MFQMRSEFDEGEDETARQEDKSDYTMTNCRDFLDDDIIDISMLDFDDHETWLLRSTTSVSFFDLHKWLKNDNACGQNLRPTDMMTENNIIGSVIDTRTFTRPKKKMGKITFDSIKKDTLHPLTADNNESCDRIKINWEEEKNRTEDSIPAILNRVQLGITPFGANGQESLEAFVNMSQSKGIDSFINMPEPEFHESLMNLSRPSVLQPTISHDAMNQTSGTIIIGMADSQILTESMMQTSIFNDMEEPIETNRSNTFTGKFYDNAFISNINSNSNSENERCILSSELDALQEVTIETNNLPLMSTVLNHPIPEPPLYNQHDSFIINKTFDKISLDNSNLSYTVATATDSKYSNTVKLKNFNSTFYADNLTSKMPLNSTFEAADMDSSELENRQAMQPEINSLFMEHGEKEMMNPWRNDQLLREDSEKCVFSVKKNQSTSITTASENLHLNTHNVTFSKEDLQYLNKSTDNMKALSKQDGNYGSQSYNFLTSNVATAPSSMNRYQTYRKLATINQIHCPSDMANSTDKMTVMSDELRPSSMENLSTVNQRINSQRNSLKFTGTKFLSRLPQNFQKSNPNLTANPADKIQMKTIQKSNFGFNIDTKKVMRHGDSTLFYRHDSANEFKNQSAKYEGEKSNESIASSPNPYCEIDSDDQLSTCSDSSQLVKCKKNLSFRKFFPNYHIKQEKTNQESTPKSERKTMENTWIVSEEDLPSPILRNCEIIVRQVGISNDLNSEPKTSSPLISPAESLQSLTKNLENHTSDEPEGIRLLETLPVNKPLNNSESSQNCENKTGGARITTNRSTNTASGIPRPASRIPAPKIIRSSTRLKNQNNSKKSIL